MGLTYAGVPLCIEDNDGKLQRWLDRWLPISDSRIIAAWPGAVWNRRGGIPLPNYSRPPRPKLNTWYYPTGAARWAFGFFIAYASQVTQILNNIGGGTQNNIPNTPQTLTMETPAGHSQSWSAYLLPPHPVSAVAASGTGVWLLPLVDARWYWQFIEGPFEGVKATAQSWTDVITDIANKLPQAAGAFGFDTPSTNYLSPNIFRLADTSFENAAVLLDCVLGSVGQRVVSTILAMGPATALTQQQQNLFHVGALDAGALQAGAVTNDNIPALMPEQIKVRFRSYANGIVWNNWSESAAPGMPPYVNTQHATAFNVPGSTAGYIKTIRSAALADFTSGGGVPDNQARLDTLAGQIAADFYNYRNWVQDQAIAGVSQWRPTGYDDFLEYSYGTQGADGVRKVQTRIHSIPYNFDGIVDQWHWDPTTWEGYGDKVAGTLDGNLSSGNIVTPTTQTITVSRCDGPVPLTTQHLTVSNIHNITGTTGQVLQAHRINTLWVIDAKDCP